MNTGIYNRAVDIISQRRFKAKSDNDFHFSEVEMKIPEIVEINRQLAKTSIKIFEIIRNGENVQEKLSTLKAQNLQAQEMVRSLLLCNGFPADYLDIKYTCEKCCDTGFSDGKRCECLDSLVGKLSAEALNAHSPLQLCSFESFDLNYYRNVTTPDCSDCYLSMSRTLSYCRSYAENFSRASKSIFMIGRTGLGKTHLSLAIANTVIRKGFNVLYDSAANYLRKIEREHFGRDNDENDTLELLLDADLIILDDLGTEYGKNFDVATIYNIINTRLNKGLPTIVNTNLDVKAIESKYDARIVSRLFSMTSLQFSGNDIRIIKASQNKK